MAFLHQLLYLLLVTRIGCNFPRIHASYNFFQYDKIFLNDRVKSTASTIPTPTTTIHQTTSIASTTPTTATELLTTNTFTSLGIQTQPTAKQTKSSNKPTQSTTKPTQSTTKPTQSTTKPTQSTTKLTQSTTKLTQSTTKTETLRKQPITASINAAKFRGNTSEVYFSRAAVSSSTNGLTIIFGSFSTLVIIDAILCNGYITLYV